MAVKLDSKYTKAVDAMPLAEYPRPQMRRDSYLCLNGTWQYAILPEFSKLEDYQGDILVPFSPETQLSGVEKTVTPKDALYYKKEFTVERKFFQDITLLHFTAVDYYCEVSLNGQSLGSHKGGFLPFTFDVSEALHEGKNVLTLKVLDPTDTSYIARGKQVSKPGNIWYPGQSGIWGTVWLESVTKGYVRDTSTSSRTSMPVKWTSPSRPTPPPSPSKSSTTAESSRPPRERPARPSPSR